MLVPRDLAWTEVPPGEWLKVLDMLAAKSRANFEKIKTWKGSCRLSIRQYLSKDFVSGLPVPQGKAEPLMQEVELATALPSTPLRGTSSSIWKAEHEVLQARHE